MKKNLPNFLTLLNLLSGSVGTILALKGDLLEAALLIRVGALFDFLDGFAARILRVYSPLGKQLDSLADLISFGLLPALILYELLALTTSSLWLPYVALVLTVCAAWRLAKFNLHTGSMDVFFGLSTTAYAIFISTLPSIIERNSWPVLSRWLLQPTVLVGFVGVGSVLLVSTIPFISLKFSSYNWRQNHIKYSMLLLGSMVIILWQIEGVALIMLLYILLGSLLQQYMAKKNIRAKGKEKA